MRVNALLNRNFYLCCNLVHEITNATIYFFGIWGIFNSVASHKSISKDPIMLLNLILPYADTLSVLMKMNSPRHVECLEWLTQ